MIKYVYCILIFALKIMCIYKNTQFEDVYIYIYLFIYTFGASTHNFQNQQNNLPYWTKTMDILPTTCCQEKKTSGKSITNAPRHPVISLSTRSSSLFLSLRTRSVRKGSICIIEEYPETIAWFPKDTSSSKLAKNYSRRNPTKNDAIHTNKTSKK